MTRKTLFAATLLLTFAACKNIGGQQTENQNEAPAQQEITDGSPVFSADSAMRYINEQCAFGPRVTGTEAHARCGDYIVSQFERFGAAVTEQKAELTTYDGTKLSGRNIIASLNPESKRRLLFCAHWDCRPWADNDANASNHHTPILGANDGASGVAVMMEMARQLQQRPLEFGIDFICFDAEDIGMPQWEERDFDSDGGWCLGSTYWAMHPHTPDYWAQFGILLDMVGGRGTTFARESNSTFYAEPVVNMVWNTAEQLGYSHIFQKRRGANVTDDHVPVNQYAGIPCIDIISSCMDPQSSCFGPTWHTVNDTPENIDTAVLKAVGHTLMQVIYNM